MTTVIQTIASPEVIPERTINKVRISFANISTLTDRCEFMVQKGYVDGSEFVVTSSHMHNISSADYETYICVAADNTKTICENIEIALLNYCAANDLV
jgi:hypothetical protein